MARQPPEFQTEMAQASGRRQPPEFQAEMARRTQGADAPRSPAPERFHQWLQIHWLTHKKTWTPPQRTMMRQARRYHLLNGGMVAIMRSVGTRTKVVCVTKI